MASFARRSTAERARISTARYGRGVNPPGWLAWHVTRRHDRNISEIAGVEPLWMAQRWHARFDRPPHQRDTAYQHTAQQIADFVSPYGDTIVTVGSRHVSPVGES